MPRKLTSAEFVERSRNVHGDRYDYSRSVYVNNGAKIEIVCKIHGSFYQRAGVHMRGFGCPKCSGKVSGKEAFIEKSIRRHGNKYNYDNVEYVNSTTHVAILCSEHGVFYQTPAHHVYGKGCKWCGLKRTIESRRVYKEDFVARSNIRHGLKYNYDLVSYNTITDKVTIICPVHGEFKQIAYSHMGGMGCSKCSGHYLNKEYFIERARCIHSDKYIYTHVAFLNGKEEVDIICPDHGLFRQTPGHHLQGQGCRKCSGRYMDREYFIEKANDIHNGTYNYGKLVYDKSWTKVEIVCRKHGAFYQTASNHLTGQGCPKCNRSKGETMIGVILTNLGLYYRCQEKFKTCKRTRALPFDFYVPRYNLCIEFDGRQHFETVDAFGGEEALRTTQTNDKIKNIWCCINSLNLLRIGYKRIKDAEEIIINVIDNIENRGFTGTAVFN